jgi:site-specific DNA-methyltransferase (adenine-specific)/modification methylase
MCGDAYNADDMAALIDHAEVDALITDPPYGIDYQPKWDDWTGSPLGHRLVTGDDQPFDPAAFLDYPTVCLWGANYYSNRLPPGGWVCWDKRLGEDADRMFGSPFELGWFRSRHTARRAIMIRVLHGGLVNADGSGQKRVHPTQKPIQLVADLLTSVTQEGELVLDPFAGSGSGLLACNHTGRRFYGMEIEPEYVGVILGRWLEATGEEPVIQEDDNGGN